MLDALSQITNTSEYRNPAPQSPLQGPNVMQPATVYSKILLRTIELEEKDYTFDKLAVERTMPANNGANEITFKRMLSLAAHTQPLVEGIPPALDQGRMVAIKGSFKSYGRAMKFTDQVSWKVVDPLIAEYTRQLALKIPETKDLLAQEALLAECQVFYASKKAASSVDGDILEPIANGDVTHIKFLSPACSPTIDEFRKIVLSMETAKVRPYLGSNFLALVSSAVMYDLITDKRVKEFMRYANTGEAFKNDVVIDLFSLVFQKAKTIKTDNTYVDAEGVTNFIYFSPSKNKNYIFIGVKEEDSDDDTMVIVVDHAAGTAAEPAKKSTIVELASLDDLDPLNIHHSLVVGEDCLYRIGVQGHTQPQFIKKELGSAGTADPINQRQSIGWKIDSLGYKVVNPDAVVDYMSIPTLYKFNMNARPDLKNQYTDYFYGYVDAEGHYWYPEQVMQTVNATGHVKYYVRGTTTEVTAIKMTKLVNPVNSGRIDANGKKDVVLGDVPSNRFALASNKEVRFQDHQVVKHSDNKFYIKGLAGVASAECVELPVTYSKDIIKADGTGVESRTAIVESQDVNLTGDPNIDGR